MSDDPPKRIPADENPWYRLATVHGEQPVDWSINLDLHARNRATWNRWVGQALSDADRTLLTQMDQFTENDFAHPNDEDLHFIALRFQGVSLPNLNSDIDLSDVDVPAHSRFDGLIFNRRIRASRTKFKGDASFKNVVFLSSVKFYGAEFQGAAWFDAAVFRDQTIFSNTEFYSLVNFNESVFEDETIFSRASFGREASFYKVGFQRDASFIGSEFQHNAQFGNASFGGDAWFVETAFQGDMYFYRSEFLGVADFTGTSKSAGSAGPLENRCITGQISHQDNSLGFEFEAHIAPSIFLAPIAHREFAKKANFYGAKFGGTVDFTNRIFQATTTFDYCQFETHAPIFAESNLHQRTTWRRVSWARTPNSPEAAGEMADAYAHLRHRMNAIQDHEKELEFFARELRAKQVELGFWRSIPIRIYAALSDYGQGLRRPALWLVALWYLCAVIYRGGSGDAVGPLQALGFSAASLGGLFGMRREFFGTFLTDFPVPWFGLMSGVQSVLGAVFVFLIGLALRNRFRIR